MLIYFKMQFIHMMVKLNFKQRSHFFHFLHIFKEISNILVKFLY